MPRDQIANEKLFPGRRIRVYLEKVQQTSKGPQLKVSRTHPRLIELLMNQEIPEIEHKEVQVRAVARDPGVRSKVAVSSEDSKVDPVGSCIGQRGTRIALSWMNFLENVSMLLNGVMIRPCLLPAHFNQQN